MKKSEFQVVLRQTFGAIEHLTATKGEEYSRDADQLANFHRSANEAGTTPGVVWLVFFNKHIDAVKSYIRDGKASSEPIHSRIDDAILYLILLKAMVADGVNLAGMPDSTMKIRVTTGVSDDFQASARAGGSVCHCIAAVRGTGPHHSVHCPSYRPSEAP